MTPPANQKVVAKQVLGYVPVHSTRVTAQVETHRKGGFRLIIAVGMDLMHTERCASIDDALKGAVGYVAATYGELERRSLRDAQPVS